jgi:hypothetical protein
MLATITSLMFELGGQVQPSSGGYTNMDITQLRAGMGLILCILALRGWLV